MTNDLTIIKSRLQKTFCKYSQEEVDEILSFACENGSFADVDYNDNSRANWLPAKHMARCKTLACAYVDDNSLGEYIKRALEYWFCHDFTCPNWFYNDLGIPQYIRIILLSCGDILEERIREKMINRLQTSVAEKWSGMNRLWFAENVIFRGVLTEDVELIKKGRDYVADTIFVSGEGQQGVQVDGSFAQHRMQLYNHGYGKSFILNAATWFDIFCDTSFAFDDSTVKVITDLYLNGTAKMGRFNAMDFSAQGRNIVRCYNPDKSGRTMQGYKKAAEILAGCSKNAETSDKLRKTIDFIDGKRNNPYEECNTAHWVLKFMTHHRDGFYSSVRMASKDVLGGDITYEGECINSENYLGGFGAYGLCMYMRDGKEYEDIFPILDWGCLPGTTTPHVEMHLGAGGYHESEFVGSVSDGIYGISAADMFKTYTYEGETASFGGKQAYFFFDECVLHLGADLYSTSEKEFHTTLDQCLLKDDVYVDGMKLDGANFNENSEKGSHESGYQMLDCRYVYHNHKAYINLDGTPLKLKAGESIGNYKRIFMSPTAPQYEVKGNTFTLVKPHVKGGASYQYAVLPDTDLREAEAFIETTPFDILLNNSMVQAVWYKNALYAVFYKAGSVSFGQHILSVENPCMLIWNKDKQKIYMSTPDKSVDEIAVKINEQDLCIKMPEDRRYRGSSVKSDLKEKN